MLTMTSHALSVVRKFTANPQLDESSGVRIDQQPSTSKLQVRAVKGPQPGDLVVEHAGGRLYLGPEAARRVSGKRLDVRSDPAGRVEFVLQAA
jgi:iron-sulfur cluster assembly protein